ncbi:hypothetical protein WG66_008113, partial [Moniliophthora roreri]
MIQQKTPTTHGYTIHGLRAYSHTITRTLSERLSRMTSSWIEGHSSVAGYITKSRWPGNSDCLLDGVCTWLFDDFGNRVFTGCAGDRVRISESRREVVMNDLPYFPQEMHQTARLMIFHDVGYRCERLGYDLYTR